MTKTAKSEASDNPWTTLAIDERYDNPWITVSHHDVLNPAGQTGIYGVIHFKNTAVGVIPLDEELNTWLVGQYRYPLSEYSWEIPEGGGPIGTDSLSSAQRELREETGIIATDWQEIVSMRLSNSVTDERGIVYLAQGLRFGDCDPEETELLRIRKVSLHQAVAMVIDGRITDSLSVAGLLKLQWLLDNDQIE